MFQKLKSFLFQNQSLRQTVAKNALWLTVGQMASRVFRVVIVVYAARVLGVESWGAFSYALSIAVFFTIFSDLGVNAFVTKEVARNHDEWQKIVANSVFLKLGLIVFAALLLVVLRPVLFTVEGTGDLLLFVILIFAFDTLRDWGSALARGLQRMEIEAASLGIANFFIAFFGIIFLSYAPSVQLLAFAYAFGTLLGLIFVIIALRKHIFEIFVFPQKEILLRILKQSWPFGLMSVLGIVMLNTDVIMLGWFKSSYEIGLYSASQKITQLLYFLPAIFASSVFPVFSQLASENRERFAAVLGKSMEFIILLAFAILGVGIMFARQIILLLFGVEYAAATTAFQILLFTLIITFPSVLLTNAFFTQNENKMFIRFFLLGAVSNIAGNALLIPILGIEGCALATIVSQILSNGIYFIKIKKEFRLSFARMAVLPLITGTVIGIVAFLLSKASIVIDMPQVAAFVAASIFGIGILWLASKRIFADNR